MLTMGRQLCLLLWSLAAGSAGAVKLYLRSSRSMADPKVGMTSQVITDDAKYTKELDESKLSKEIKAGSKGTIEELKIAEGLAKFHPEDPPLDCKVELYADPGFKGWKAEFGVGDFKMQEYIKKGGKNDQCSSMKILGDNCIVEVYQHWDFKGWKATYKTGVYDKDAYVAGGSRDNDMSSLKVKKSEEAYQKDAWIPIKALKDYESWCPPNGCPGDTTTLAPTTTAPSPGTTTAGTTLAPGPTGKPGNTDFRYASCRRTEQEVQNAYTSPMGMSHMLCFQHCHNTPGMHYFAVSEARCYCSELPMGSEVSSDNCDAKCVGDPEENCGGVANAASVYLMMDCTPPTKSEKLQEEADEATELIGAYSRFAGESCGGGDKDLVEVGGSTSMSGTVDDCKLACWKKEGSSKCHGFTFDQVKGECEFHAGVIGDSVTRKPSLTCYFKKV